MIALLDSSQDLTVCQEEIGCPVEQLLTPLTRFRRRSKMFAIDNGAFSNFNSKAFESLLNRERENRENCRFVAVPDVVGSARRTLECFEYWFPRLGGWKLALVAQDGQEDLPIRWDLTDAIFIGGSTNWKLSRHAEAVIRAAQSQGKWVHVGRINEPDRFQKFWELGVDSFDGSGISQYSKQRFAINRQIQHPKLFQETVGVI